MFFSHFSTKGNFNAIVSMFSVKMVVTESLNINKTTISEEHVHSHVFYTFYCYCNSTLSLTGSNPFPCLLEFLLAVSLFITMNTDKDSTDTIWRDFVIVTSAEQRTTASLHHECLRNLTCLLTCRVHSEKRGLFTQYSNSHSHKVSMICHARFR